MSYLQCPYCSVPIPESKITKAIQYPCFPNSSGIYCSTSGMPSFHESCIAITFYKCNGCGEYVIHATGVGSAVDDVDIPIRPISSAKQYPSYIPEAIRKDYEEACAIVHLSPKASATLSRRCLQGMIRDFWNIKAANLYQEINELQGKIPNDLWNSIDALRQLGNIGAHMEKDTDIIVDIDPEEAQTLIQLIELLMKEWYIARNNRESLFSSILTTNNEKQALRKRTE